MKELRLDGKLNIVEEPVEIMDREVKQLKQSRIPIVKVRWNSKRGPEFTWKREDQIRANIVETDKVIRTVETDIVKLVVEIESFGMSADEFDKETGSSDGLQPKQVDLSCVHAINELHLHEIHVVPSNHEADQTANSVDKEKIANSVNKDRLRVTSGNFTVNSVATKTANSVVT
ncbi:hypothetical protein Tco_0512184 [Tanacetum coccineum]